jgi:hypothetical protein
VQTQILTVGLWRLSVTNKSPAARQRPRDSYAKSSETLSAPLKPRTSQIDDYAKRRKFEIENPHARRKTEMATKEQLQEHLIWARPVRQPMRR